MLWKGFAYFLLSVVQGKSKNTMQCNGPWAYYDHTYNTFYWIRLFTYCSISNAAGHLYMTYLIIQEINYKLVYATVLWTSFGSQFTQLKVLHLIPIFKRIYFFIVDIHSWTELYTSHQYTGNLITIRNVCDLIIQVN